MANDRTWAYFIGNVVLLFLILYMFTVSGEGSGSTPIRTIEEIQTVTVP